MPRMPIPTRLIALLGAAGLTCLGGCDRTAPSPGAPRALAAKPATAADRADPGLTVPPPAELLAALTPAGGPPPGLRPLAARGKRTLWGFPTSRTDALAQRTRLRELTNATGLYPLIITSRLSPMLEQIDDGGDPESSLAWAAGFDGRGYLRERARECLAENESEADFSEEAAHPGEPDGFALLADDDLEKDSDFFILLIPTTKPWEVFAHLQYGGWNEYPSAEEHVAVMKHWFDRYGAEPVIVTGDVIEMLVARPPVDRAGAEELALEQFGYTYGDLVYQGYEEFARLAAALRGRKHWFFWWD